MSPRDARRLRREAAEYKEPLPIYREAGWACSGFALASLLAWIAWNGLPQDVRTANALQGALLIVAAIALGIMAVVSFIADRFSRKAKNQALDMLLKDMDDTWGPAAAHGDREAVG